MSYSKVSYPKSIADIPDGEVFAILYPESTTIPGDERSRTNPGHGYGEHTVSNWRIEVYKDEESWIKEIKELTARKGYMAKEFKAVLMTPITITVKTEVVVKK